jgi:long-chain acyl-CoA synthetase
MEANLRTIPALLLHRAEATPANAAFLHPVGDRWETLTWRDTLDRVRTIAGGLRALGLGPEECVGILSGTRLEWLLADFAIVCAGGATTTLYPSNTAEECAFILADAGAGVAFVENAEQLAKLRSRRAELPGLRRAIVFEGEVDDDGWAMSLPALEALGAAEDRRDPGRFREVADAVRPEGLASIIYTSGTTGRPKGVEATHEAWAAEAWSSDAVRMIRPDDLQYFWLPLAHAFGKMMAGLQLRVGFPTAIDGRVDRLVENLATLRPTYVCGVPRVFEKVHNKVVAAAREGGAAKFAIFRWAFDVGARAAALRREGKHPSPWLAAQHALADRLVFSAIRARFGGRLRFFVSGSAPLSREMLEFFDAAGLRVLEGYGLTESCAASVLNLPDRFRLGTAGAPMPGIEVQLAEDGEVLLRAASLMRGYHGQPERTRETIDADGWLHTGDLGVLEDGFLRVTDRKKDLIKTSGGKFVAPTYLENKLKALCPFIANVLVHGEGRNFCSALITLDEEAIRKWAAEHGRATRSLADLAADPAVLALIDGYVARMNADLPSYETVKRFAILPRDFSQDEGELTASQKVRRKVVEERWRHVLDGFYERSIASLR